MIFRETSLPGAYEISLERSEDERGWLARTFSADTFRERGLNADVAQCSASYTVHAGTLRGLHYQTGSFAECKLVHCTRGAVYDVIVDLRPDSPTYCRWCAVELTAENGRMVYIPVGMAHGFQTLVSETELQYQMSTPYSPKHARGVRWNDPAFGIAWPEADDRRLSDKDSRLPDFRP